MDNEKVYVKDVYDTSDKSITLDIPDQKTVIMYCDKNTPTQCIYLDLNDTGDMFLLQPFLSFLIYFLMIAMGFFFIYHTTKGLHIKKDSFNDIYLVFIFFFLLGCFGVFFQVRNFFNYYELKKSGNVVDAHIYSEIYSSGGKDYLYKPVSYFYVDHQKYIYVNDSYIKGSLEENYGKTFEIYYNKENPSDASLVKNPVNFYILLISLLFVVISFPFIFFKTKMEKKFKQNLINRFL